MNFKALTLIFFSFLLPLFVFATEISVYEHPDGANFEELPHNSGKLFLGINFVEIAEWQQSPFKKFGDLYFHFTQKNFLSDKEEYLAISKGANIISLPVDKVINRDLFFNPGYHQRMNPSFNLVTISNNPLVFQTTQSIYGLINLTTQMYVKFLGLEELKSANYADNVPFAVTVRYSTEFNRTLDHLITVSEFYGLNGNSTLVITYLVLGIKKSMLSSGFGSGIFQTKMKSYIKDSATESLTQLNRLLGL